MIESMKMEISLESPNEGSVHSLLKSEGQRVSPGENLLLIATTS
ncbi:MAG: biotin/lipoyl-containing protein [Verrucomicrobiota bacterium]|nr:biotin/lipoyl-containing protein [Verrucomicrobiota bacterium]